MKIAAALCSLFLAFSSSFAATNLTFTPDDKLVATVAAFLQSQNVTNFASGLAPSVADWEAELHRFGRAPSAEQRSKLEQHNKNNILNLTRSGEALALQGRRFGIFSPAARWTFKSASADSRYESSYEIHQASETMPSIRVIRLTFLRESSEPPEAASNGEYAIDLQFAAQFPTGWRIFNGLKWALFPPDVASPDLHADMILAANLPPYGGNLTPTNDPALGALGEKVSTFLTKKDPAYFAAELIHPLDLLYKLRQERAPGEELPPRAEMEKMFAGQRDEITASARDVLAEMERLGLNFTNAKVKAVVADDVDPQNSAGLPQSFGAKEIFITLALPEATSSTSRKIPPGDYVLASARADRMAGRWYLQKIRWLSFPKGVLSDEDIARQEFENYVAKHRRLPPGTPAPEIEMLSLKGSDKSKLSDFRGKIVVLEWWATWCGPCQEPMAKLQKVAEARQDWRGKVELITLSIDDDPITPRKHLDTRGWTNTLNFWAGGDWGSATAKAFRISAVPTVYVISPEGKVVESGHGGSSWGYTVDQLLKAEPISTH